MDGLLNIQHIVSVQTRPKLRYHIPWSQFSDYNEGLTIDMGGWHLEGNDNLSTITQISKLESDVRKS